MTDAPHIPVMLNEVLAALSPKDDEIYVDGTFGAGGYSRAILKAARCKVYAIDQDPDALTFAEKLRAEFPGRFIFLAGNFADMVALLAREGVESVHGVVLDIGVSSMQIDQADRGFSFRQDGPLDMRMSKFGRSAADVVNEASEAELADIFYHYGEEKASRRIAKAIIARRIEQPFTRTSELAALIGPIVGKSGPSDPATRAFQGLRIFVNDELGALERGLQAAEKILAPKGRLIVVTFHSLEDRMVKRFTYSRSGKLAGASRHLPQTDDAMLPSFLLPKPDKKKPSAAECNANPRARSATLRAAVRTEHPIIYEVRA